MRRIIIPTLLIVLLAVMITPTAAQADQRCFSETGNCISGPIRAYWERNGGLAVFGFPITPQSVEQVEGQPLQVQWFERDRLEIQASGQVTAGRLGVERLAQIGTPWTQGSNAPAGQGCTAFPETGYQICGAFATYWRANGGLERFGFPVTGEFVTELDGQSYTVQYFERRRFELHPEIGPNAVLLGLLGSEVRANLAEPEPISFSGNGQQVLPPFTLPLAFTRVTLTHQGSRNFIVRAYRETGIVREELLANAIGNYNGATLLRGTPGEQMFIGVQADGAWTIQISAIEFDANAVRFSGRGDAVSPLFTPPAQGAVPFVFSHDGQRNFIVWARCGPNLLNDSLGQNTIGPASGSAVVTFRGSPCVWEVRGDGNWSIAPQ